jgi:arylsulfatase A-like enzyme
MKPGWAVNSRVFGKHAGYERQEMAAAFCIAGPGIEHGYFDAARTVDITPTILKLLGESPDPRNFDGKPIPEVVD